MAGPRRDNLGPIRRPSKPLDWDSESGKRRLWELHAMMNAKTAVYPRATRPIWVRSLITAPIWRDGCLVGGFLMIAIVTAVIAALVYLRVQ